MSGPVTINPMHALRLTSGALDLADNNATKAVALLVHAMAGVLAMSLPKDGIAALIEDRGGDFGGVLAEAMPMMAELVAKVEGRMLATMPVAGQA